MENEAKWQVPSWNQIYAMLHNQTEKIRHSYFKPYVIVGITRDGWVPARIVPDLLGIRGPAATIVEFYVGVAETKKRARADSGRFRGCDRKKKRCWLMP